MRIDIWSDVVCPFCWIGKRHLEAALEAFRSEHPGTEVEVVWRAFELDSAAPRHGERGDEESAAQMLSRKYGMTLTEAEAGQEQMADRFRELGLGYDWRSSRVSSTFDAHRLAALAADHDLADQVDEALRRAYFTNGERLSDPEVLRRIGVRAGLPADAVDGMLTGDGFGDRVRDDTEAARGIGVTGVPFFVFDGRLAVSGAQPVEVFGQALEQALVGRQP
ncbi:DsbA family oxidoreductase [Dietzia sp. PP-33]|jgi:predicted DsbA family dithiol-disulfide isomerase|uniref:DsbA family oxidoreductase n=1 Tax=Dietzia sp. PP-33 TaxID=2957500 RepID=UPI0029AF385D|nr:DsbA family oxidoreductase [Dietzia sp. PP-33]MDX2355540.1 DsbA family oxidoreductase [Dietzia sp. PP-33]